MRIHQERAALADGLSTLSDPDIIAKVRDAPTRMKRRSKELLHKLDKLGVTLDENGFVDYSQVESKKELKLLKDNETLVKVVLMERDLEFEYPHKLGKILPEIERPVSPPPPKPPLVTYEVHYNLDPKSTPLLTA